MPNLKIGVWNGWLFMSVFILQMSVMMFADKNIQNRTHIPVEARHNKSERSISAIANFIWLLALVYSVFLPLKLENNWFYLGFTVFVIGVMFLAAATLSFMTTPIDELITKGIYQFSRHPMYLSTFFVCLGTGIATMSWLFIFLSLLIAVCFRQEALVEERICLEQYGNEYRKYMDRVPRWLGIPR
jgi:protein-S-isoprenylcysteine O-methyltransferase Ste14